MSEENSYYISALFDHIDNAFQNGNDIIANKIHSFIEKGLLKGREIDDKMFPLKGPSSNPETGFILLQAGFISYVWTVSYFMIGLIEIYADKQEANLPIVNLVDSEKFTILNHTFAWGRSLKPSTDEDFIPWPNDIPNPTHTETRAEQANNLCVLATTYLMYHELGHLILHKDLVNFKKIVSSSDYVASVEDNRRLRMMEIQADVYAIDCMFAGFDSEHDRYMKFLGAIVAHLAEFFLRKFPDARSKNYPDLDERLIRVLEKVDIQEPFFKIHIDLACTIGLQLFLTLTFADFIPPNTDQFIFDDFDGLKGYLFEIIAAWKEKYNSYSN